MIGKNGSKLALVKRYVESDEDNEITEDAYDDDIVDAAEVSNSSTNFTD